MMRIQSIKTKKTSSDTPSIKIIDSKENIQERYLSYLTDESRMSNGHADKIIFPQSEFQISETTNQANLSSIPVTISAGKTGIVGGAVPKGGILLSLEKMEGINNIRWDIYRKAWFITVDPGLSLEKLQNILDQQRVDHFLKKSRDSDLVKFCSESDAWFYPPNPTEKTAHIGGTIATNASGARSLKYGQTRRFVSALRIVLSNGTVIYLKRGENILYGNVNIEVIDKHFGNLSFYLPRYQSPDIKNTVGYHIQYPMDIIDLFIGSEGTLGIFSEVELMLCPKPELVFAGIAFFHAQENAISFVRRVQEEKIRNNPIVNPSALEYFGPNVLILLKKNTSGYSIPDHAQAAIYFEQETIEKNFENDYSQYEKLLLQYDISMDNIWGGIDTQELKCMTEFRHLVPETVNKIIGQRQKKMPHLQKISTDFVLPSVAMKEMYDFYRQILDKENIEYVIFGHIGENHLHVNILPQNDSELEKATRIYRQLAKKAAKLKGSLSGEHGIGKIKKFLLPMMFTERKINEMKTLKKSLDTHNILGRETLF